MNEEEIKLLNEMLENCKGGFDYYTDPKAEAKAKALESALNLQQRIDKAINELITLYQIIGEQPSRNVEEDNWLLRRIESIQKILGENNE